MQNGSLRVEGTGNGLVFPDAIGGADDWMFFALTYDYETGTYALTWRGKRLPAGQLGDTLYDVESAFWVGAYDDDLSHAARELIIDDLRIHSSVLTAEQISAEADAKP